MQRNQFRLDKAIILNQSAALVQTRIQFHDEDEDPREVH